LPSATISGSATVCQNEAATVVFTGSGGTSPYTFTYRLNGGTVQTIVSGADDRASFPVPTNIADTYTYDLLEVADASATLCSQNQTGSARVVVNPAPSASISGPATVCQNMNAEITFTGSNGTEPYTFTYKFNGGAAQTISTTSGSSVSLNIETALPGEYLYELISVADASTTGCTQLQPGQVKGNILPGIKPEFNPIGPLCLNSLAPELPPVSTNGIKGTWNPSGISTSTAGDFTYTFIPETGQCASEATMTITIEELISPVFEPIGPFCVNTTPPELPAVSSNGVSGSWNPATISTSASGTSSYTFTPDNNQCAIPATIQITVNEPLIPEFDAIGPLCQFSTAPVLPSVSKNGVTGTWNPSAISTTDPGSSTYLFTPDASFCSSPYTMNIEVDETLTPVFDQIGPLCKNSTPPALPSVSTNGVSGTWNPSSISTSTSGTSTYIFTPDATQCAVPFSMTITVDDQIQPLFDPIGPLCLDSEAPALPNISKNGIIGTWTPATINTSISGTASYTFSPLDGQCAASATMDIEVIKELKVTITQNKPIIISGGTADLTAKVEGGSGSYSYLWNDPLSQTTATATNLRAGLYAVTVTDLSTGCAPVTQSYGLTEPQPFVVTATVVERIHCFEGTGKVEVLATGGTPPYQGTGVYSVSAGIYQYTVYDANGIAAASNYAELTNPVPLNCKIESENISCQSTSDGSITVSEPSGGSGFYNVRINNEPWRRLSKIIPLNFSNLGEGNYQIEIQDGFYLECTKVMATITMTKYYIPEKPVSTGDLYACDTNPNLPLDANNAIVPVAGIEIEWFSQAEGGILIKSPTLNEIGEVTFWAMSINPQCINFEKTPVKLTIKKEPPLLVSKGDIEECETIPIQLLDARTAIDPVEGYTINWYTKPTGGILVPDPILNSVGVISYYAEAYNGICSSPQRTRVTLTINPLPANPVSTGDLTECIQTPPQTLDANTAIVPVSTDKLVWFDAASGGNEVASPTLNQVGTVTYYTEARNSHCISLQRTAVKLTIEPELAAPVSTGDQVECEKIPIQMLDARSSIIPVQGVTVIWYDDPTGGNVVANPVLNEVNVRSFFAEARQGVCVSKTRTQVNLTIYPLPAVPVSTGNLAECAQTPIQTLDANNAIVKVPGDHIIWYDAPIAGNVIASPSLNAIGTVTFYAEANNTECVNTSRTAVSLTLKTIPADPISTGDITECLKKPIQTISAQTAIVPVEGITTNWYDELGNKIDSPTLNSVGSVTYYAEAWNGICSSPNRIKVTLTILPEILPPTSKGNLAECAETPIQTLDANDAIIVAPGTTINWYDAASGGNKVESPILDTINSVTYFAESDNGTCVSLSRTAVSLTIKTIPENPVSRGDIIECITSPTQTLDANQAIIPVQGISIVWYDSEIGGTIVDFPILNTLGTAIYYAQAENGICSSPGRTKVVLQLLAEPLAPVSTGNLFTCETFPATTLDANAAILPVPGVSTIWYTAATGGQRVESPTLSQVGSISYYAEANNGICSSSTRTPVKLTIQAGPKKPTSTGDLAECANNPLQTLNASTAIVSVPGISVVWYDAPSGGNIIASTTPNKKGPIH